MSNASSKNLSKKQTQIKFIIEVQGIYRARDV